MAVVPDPASAPRDAARPARGVPTRTLLSLAALGTVQGLVLIALAPALAAAATASPPLYALLAMPQTLLVFVAARLAQRPGAATLTAFFAGVLAVPFSAIGFLAIVPLVVAGAVVDVALLAARRVPTRARFALAGAAAGAALFAVSLPVFSPEHLAPEILLATLAARVLSGAMGALLSGVVARALGRAGIRRI